MHRTHQPLGYDLPLQGCGECDLRGVFSVGKPRRNMWSCLVWASQGAMCDGVYCEKAKARCVMVSSVGTPKPDCGQCGDAKAQRMTVVQVGNPMHILQWRLVWASQGAMYACGVSMQHLTTGSAAVFSHVWV